jgi:hypothetical protein
MDHVFAAQAHAIEHTKELAKQKPQSSLELAYARANKACFVDGNAHSCKAASMALGAAMVQAKPLSDVAAHFRRTKYTSTPQKVDRTVASVAIASRLI